MCIQHNTSMEHILENGRRYFSFTACPWMSDYAKTFGLREFRSRLWRNEEPFLLTRPYRHSACFGPWAGFRRACDVRCRLQLCAVIQALNAYLPFTIIYQLLMGFYEYAYLLLINFLIVFVCTNVFAFPGHNPEKFLLLKLIPETHRLTSHSFDYWTAVCVVHFTIQLLGWLRFWGISRSCFHQLAPVTDRGPRDDLAPF